ncbi:uncharacterized protein LOC127427225 [Myxocyprinus asiaticus]|uniref:uncharacterized protein LOC127427225 n=1 Tax=Myxocyprinus asiaticus TaxID=70543 RepID=UPI002221AD5A|nr:uncharacterized protein LOC127427225 [Myxocyprinus asiaticus]
MSEKMMAPPVLPVDGPQQIKLMTQCADLFSVSCSETDTDGDSECEPENGSDTTSEEQHLEQQQLHMHSDIHPQESHTSPQTQPKTNGDLHIHTVLDCGFEVMTCQFSEDGSMLAAGLNDGSIKVYSTDSGELIQTLKDNSSSLFSMPVTALRFTVTGQSHCQIMATYASGYVCCWYVWGGQKLWESNEASEAGVQRQTLSLSVSPSGEQALTSGSDSVIHLYDLTTHQRLQSFSASSSRTVMDGHRFRVFAVTFHPECAREFISGGWDNTIQANNHFSCNNSSQIHSIHIQFWDTRQQRSIRMISGPHVCGDALQIDPTANQILTGSWRKYNTLEVWDYSSGQRVREVPHDQHGESRIYTCHWFGQEHIVAAGSQPNMLRVIRRKTFTTESCLFGLSSAVFSSSVCPSGKWMGLIAASSGNKVFLLDKGWHARKDIA